jgi:hypothetical protein
MPLILHSAMFYQVTWACFKHWTVQLWMVDTLVVFIRTNPVLNKGACVHVEPIEDFNCFFYIYWFFSKVLFLYMYLFSGQPCVGHSVAYVAHLVFFRDVWIRTERAAVASRLATNLATTFLLGPFSVIRPNIRPVGNTVWKFSRITQKGPSKMWVAGQITMVRCICYFFIIFLFASKRI